MKSDTAHLALIIASFLAADALAAPRVVVSIPPIASLVDGVLGGADVSRTVVPPGASLHSFALKPSDAEALQSADVVFWVGPSLETFLEKPIANLGAGAEIVALMEAPGVNVLKGREGGVWDSDADAEDHGDEADHHDEDHDHDHDEHDHSVDGHLWLDPTNARAMVAAIRDAMIKADAPNAATYTANAAAFSARIDALDGELSTLLKPVARKPFIVFHDGYQYLEKRYGLNAAGSITVSPDRPPGAGRIAEIKAAIEDRGAMCVFAEPQFEPKLVATLIEGTPARTATLDPEGASLKAGPDLYFELMRALGKNLSDCLAGG